MPTWNLPRLNVALALMLSAAALSAHAAPQLCLSKACIGAPLSTLSNVQIARFNIGALRLDSSPGTPSEKFAAALQAAPCRPTQGLMDYYDPDGNYVQVKFVSLAGAPSGQHYVITALRMQLRGVATPEQMQSLQVHLIQRWSLLDGNPGKHGPAKPNVHGYPDLMLTQTTPAYEVRAGSAKVIETDGYLWTKEMYRQFEGGSAVWVNLPYGSRPAWAQSASEQAHSLQSNCSKP